VRADSDRSSPSFIQLTSPGRRRSTRCSFQQGYGRTAERGPEPANATSADLTFVTPGFIAVLVGIAAIALLPPVVAAVAISHHPRFAYHTLAVWWGFSGFALFVTATIDVFRSGSGISRVALGVGLLPCWAFYHITAVGLWRGSRAAILFVSLAYPVVAVLGVLLEEAATGRLYPVRIVTLGLVVPSLLYIAHRITYRPPQAPAPEADRRLPGEPGEFVRICTIEGCGGENTVRAYRCRLCGGSLTGTVPQRRALGEQSAMAALHPPA